MLSETKTSRLVMCACVRTVRTQLLKLCENLAKMAKGGQSDQMKSLKKSNDSLKKQLENARKDIKRLEERVEVQEHASKERNGGPSREVRLETERSLSWLHESESDIQSELRAIH